MGWHIGSKKACVARLAAAGTVTAAVLALAIVVQVSDAQDKGDPGKKDGQPAKGKAGVTVNLPKAFQGYTLIFPMNSTKTHLINMEGKIVRTWESAGNPALSTYLLPNGDLLRPITVGGGMGGGKGGGKGFGGPGAGGRIQQFTFDGELVWDYTIAGDKLLPHHDVTPIMKDNKLHSVLVIAGQKKTAQETAAAGRNGGSIQVDGIVEIRPTGKTTGEVIWEWQVWDHLIQDFDNTKAHYGNVAEHPELVDVNFGGGFGNIAKGKDLDKLKGIGYIGGGKGAFGGDWTHMNSVIYNADLDQIMLSVHGFSEFWVIDHSTTKAQAAGHTGGKYGKGGDLLYRWGNPRAYRAGTEKDRQLFNQHHAQWIPKGLPGAGNILVFNNGVGRPGGNYSTVEELVPPMNDKGVYAFKPGTAYGPEKPLWTYSAPKKTDLYSMAISGTQRLPNGNTLICEGMSGTVMEVTPDKELVWRYASTSGGFGGGFGGGFDGKGPGGFDPKGGGGKGFDPKGGDGKGGQPPFGGKGGMGGMGGGMGGLFRAYRYAPDYPGLAGRTLTPVATSEEPKKKDGDKK